MLTSSKFISTRLSRRTFLEWKYYIPLYSMPKVVVTMDMLDKIEPQDNDKRVIREYKIQVYDKLSYYLGRQIVKHSPHVNNGYLVRSGIYLGTAVCLVPLTEGISIVSLVFFLIIYLPYSDLHMEQSNLHLQYLKLLE